MEEDPVEETWVEVKHKKQQQRPSVGGELGMRHILGVNLKVELPSQIRQPSLSHITFECNLILFGVCMLPPAITSTIHSQAKNFTLRKGGTRLSSWKERLCGVLL